MALLALKIDVTKLDKARFFQGKNGAVYADLVLNLKDDLSPDQYGNCGFMAQSVTKDERQAGVKLPICGNAKLLAGGQSQPAPAAPRQSAPASHADDSTPF